MKTPIKKVFLNTDDFRFEISPLENDHSLQLDKALRCIMKCSNTTWKELSVFLGLKNQSEAFKTVYGSPSTKVAELRRKVRELYVVDADGDKAYLYRHDHKPEQVPVEYISPVINNNEPEGLIVTQFIPTLFAARSSIKEHAGVMSMTLAPTSGYIYDPLSDKQTTVGKPVSFLGNYHELTAVLKRALFIGTEIGVGGVTISLDDQNGNSKSITSTDITLEVKENTEIVDVKITLPSKSALKLNEYTKVEGLSVSEKNDRVLTVKVTPFNCSMTVPNKLEAIPDRGTVVINGTPAFINNRLNNISVLATDKTAQLGVLAICGSTKLLKYYKFEYASDTTASEQTPRVTARSVKSIKKATVNAKPAETTPEPVKETTTESTTKVETPSEETK